MTPRLVLYPPDEVKRLLVQELQSRLPMFAGMARVPAEKVVDALYARGVCLAEVIAPEILEQARREFGKGNRIAL